MFCVHGHYFDHSTRLSDNAQKVESAPPMMKERKLDFSVKLIDHAETEIRTMDLQQLDEDDITNNTLLSIPL